MCMLNLLSPLHHWRIGARLFVAFGAVLALLLVVAVVAVWNLNTLEPYHQPHDAGNVG